MPYINIVLGQLRLRKSLCDSTKPLPQPVLTYHQKWSVAFTRDQFHQKCSKYVFRYCTFEITTKSSRCQWVNYDYFTVRYSTSKELCTSWWSHQMETFSALLALCVGNSLVTGEFPSQRPVTQSFDVFFDLCLNKCLSKQSWGWWFEMPSCSWWCYCNVICALLLSDTSRFFPYPSGLLQ